MREIKFRAWDKTTRLMMPYAHVGSYGMLEVASFHDSAYGPGGCPDIVLEQFTGLYDKNGKEIYEGDILHCGIHPMYIEWNEEFGQWYASDMDNAYHTPLWVCLHGNNAVLTGNIHENPELLEANK